MVEAEKIRYYLEKAVYLAQNGRPGPVLIDIPMNIQRAQIEPKKLESFFNSAEYKRMPNRSICSEVQIDGVVRLILAAKRPVVLVGGGVRTAKGVEELLVLIEKTGIPVVTSLMGLDAIPHNNHAFFGMIGSYGNRYSNLALANCDMLMILGSRLDSRQTGTRPEAFVRAAKKIHVDIDPNELNAKISVDIAIRCDIKNFLAALNKKLAGHPMMDFSPWYKVIEGYKAKYPTYAAPTDSCSIDPNRFLEILSDNCSPGGIICLDVGQNQMWAAQSFHLKEGQRMLISGGMGAMGFALPAALGAAKAEPGKQVIVISGDGGIQINIQDMDTIAKHRLPIKIFILNNGCLGMVRQFQDMYFEGRHQATVIGYSCPDICKIAKAYGIPSYIIGRSDEIGNVVDKAMQTEGPVLVDVKLEQTIGVNPKLIVNRPIEDMYPYLDREELKKMMIVDLLEEKDVSKK